MISATELTGPLAALVVGGITSVHCLGMCGPLACAVCTRGDSGASGHALAGYHGFRVLSYTACGALAGWLGGALAPFFAGWFPHVLPWAFALVFAAVALGLDQKLVTPHLMQSRFAGALKRLAKYPPTWRGIGLGAVSPLLPCGPLYLVLGVAALSASPTAGAALLGAFAVGTVPLAWIVQGQWFRWQQRWSPAAMDRGRRALAAVCVVLMVVRAFSQATPEAPTCPLCP